MKKMKSYEEAKYIYNQRKLVYRLVLNSWIRSKGINAELKKILFKLVKICGKVEHWCINARYFEQIEKFHVKKCE